jgi:exo-1,4-beta-D-glucosaminidase
LLSSNFYWLSTRPAELQWKKTVYFDDPPPKDLTYSASIYTPASRYDDLTQLNRLPRIQIVATASITPGEQGPQVHVALRNPSAHLAFQVRLGIHCKGQEMEILPVLWEDNYMELMPGESREVSAQYLTAGVLNGSTELSVSGWNMDPLNIPLPEPVTGAVQAHGRAD